MTGPWCVFPSGNCGGLPYAGFSGGCSWNNLPCQFCDPDDDTRCSCQDCPKVTCSASDTCLTFSISVVMGPKIDPDTGDPDGFGLAVSLNGGVDFGIISFFFKGDTDPNCSGGTAQQTGRCCKGNETYLCKVCDDSGGGTGSVTVEACGDNAKECCSMYDLQNNVNTAPCNFNCNGTKAGCCRCCTCGKPCQYPSVGTGCGGRNCPSSFAPSIDEPPLLDYVKSSAAPYRPPRGAMFDAERRQRFWEFGNKRLYQNEVYKHLKKQIQKRIVITKKK